MVIIMCDLSREIIANNVLIQKAPVGNTKAVLQAAIHVLLSAHVAKSPMLWWQKDCRKIQHGGTRDGDRARVWILLCVKVKSVSISPPKTGSRLLFLVVETKPRLFWMLCSISLGLLKSQRPKKQGLLSSEAILCTGNGLTSAALRSWVPSVHTHCRTFSVTASSQL